LGVQNSLMAALENLTASYAAQLGVSKDHVTVQLSDVARRLQSSSVYRTGMVVILIVEVPQGSSYDELHEHMTQLEPASVLGTVASVEGIAAATTSDLSISSMVIGGAVIFSTTVTTSTATETTVTESIAVENTTDMSNETVDATTTGTTTDARLDALALGDSESTAAIVAVVLLSSVSIIGFCAVGVLVWRRCQLRLRRRKGGADSKRAKREAEAPSNETDGASKKGADDGAKKDAGKKAKEEVRQKATEEAEVKAKKDADSMATTGGEASSSALQMDPIMYSL